MKSFQLKFLWAFIAGSLFLTSCSDDDDDMEPDQGQQMSTIAQIATDNGNFTILLDALGRTGLDAVAADASQTLTVFAPTDEAFGNLLTELNAADLDEVEALLGTDGLENVLKYHILGSVVTSDAVPTGYVPTLGVNASEDALSIYTNTASGVRINDRADVDIPDLMASNGVIHVIDEVILPMTMFQLLDVNADYATLVTALETADGDLDALFNDATAGPFTLFAPDEAAFADLLEELSLADVPALVAALGTDGLADVLTYHAVSGNVNRNEVPAGDVPTVNGANISIDLNGGSSVEITDVLNRVTTVTSFDIQGTNGVIHGINKVKLPS